MANKKMSPGRYRHDPTFFDGKKATEGEMINQHLKQPVGKDIAHDDDGDDGYDDDDGGGGGRRRDDDVSFDYDFPSIWIDGKTSADSNILNFAQNMGIVNGVKEGMGTHEMGQHDIQAPDCNIDLPVLQLSRFEKLREIGDEIGLMHL